jgi:hypothetical protein
VNKINSESGARQAFRLSANKIHIRIARRISVKFGCEARHQNTLVNYVGNLITLHEDQMEGFIKFLTSGLFYGNFYSDIKHISSRSETVIPNVLGCVECGCNCPEQVIPDSLQYICTVLYICSNMLVYAVNEH